MKKQLFLFFIILITSMATANAQLISSGWRRPAATHLPNDWTNPQNAFGSDDNYAEVLHQSGCRCPFMDLSWDNGVNYSSSNIFGPYGTSDSFKYKGDSTDGWGHIWTDAELSDSAFVLRIWNSSTLLKQGYSNFGFAIPAGSMISGIEVRVEAHGDSSYTMDYVDIIEANVYYMVPTSLNEVYDFSKPVNIFPNPANDVIHVQFMNNLSEQRIQILNIQGRVMKETVFENVFSNENYKLDVSDLAAGIYFIHVDDGRKMMNARFIIR